jgi:hypothetical protein
MGSTLNVKLCSHGVWREKYGCSKCADEEQRRAAAYDRTVQESDLSDPEDDNDMDPSDGDE